jgi:hypothetical protein
VSLVSEVLIRGAAGYAILGLVLAPSSCHRSAPGPQPAPEPPRPEWVIVPAGTQLRQFDGGAFQTRVSAQFATLPPRPIKLPPGRTEADRKAIEELNKRRFLIRGPYGQYWVFRNRVTATDEMPRDIPDSLAGVLFAAIETEAGEALARAYCVEGLDMIAMIGETEIVSDRTALRMLDSARVDPASFARIERMGKATYVRPPGWGRPPGDRC